MDSIVVAFLDLPNPNIPEVKANLNRQLAFSCTVGVLRTGTFIAVLYCLKVLWEGPPSLARITMMLGLNIITGNIAENARKVLKAQAEGSIKHPEKRSNWMQISDAIYSVITHECYFPNLLNPQVRAHLNRERCFSLATAAMCAAGVCGTIRGLQLLLLCSRSADPSLSQLLKATALTVPSVSIFVSATHILHEQSTGASKHPENSGPCMQIAHAISRMVYEILPKKIYSAFRSFF